MQTNGNATYPAMVAVMVHNEQELRSIYALLGGASLGALTASAKPLPAGDPGAHIGAVATHQHKPSAAETGGAPIAGNGNGDPVEVDAHGWPWSEDKHASTKTKTKEGLWRMKVGVSRPDPKPGFPKDTGTGTASGGAAPAPGGSAPATTADEDDEFAAFRTAMDKDKSAEAAAAAAAPARKWTDADLGALCNQAAVKLGDPAPVKELIQKHIPDGAVAHSRNIPEANRAAFAKAVEEKAGITFAG